MSDYYKIIQMNIPFFKEGVEFTRTDGHYNVGLENSISDELYNFILSKGLTVHLVEAFYRNLRHVSPIHTDSIGQSNLGKLNFIFDSGNSEMRWYSPKEGEFPINKTTVIGTKYKQYETNQVDVIESAHLTGPAIVQVGVPHNIVNVTGPRTCVSIVLFKNRQMAKMEEIIEAFSEYIVE